MATLRIANKYENVDVRQGLSKAYMHVKGKRLQPLCRKLGVKFAQALVGFEESRSFCHPVFDGVVVSTRSAPKLLEAINDRNRRSKTPAARARKREVRQAWADKIQARVDRFNRLGIAPDSRTAEWLERGHIDEDLAEFIGFKTGYRHKHTDYEQHFDDEEFEELRSIGFSGQEATNEMRDNARASRREDPIPSTWDEYLQKYGLDSSVAKALAGVLRSPSECHPIWFKEAEIAVRRAGLSVEGLSYEAVKRAIEKWRGERAEK